MVTGALWLALLCSCSSQASARQLAIPLHGEAWPEADRLFHQDERWLGSDAAFSVPLCDGRILWLFGDTFVAKTEAHTRAESVMVRNTIGVQNGADPVTAEMSFHWKGTAAAPASFFSEEGEHWFWPQHGIRLGRGLLLFLMREHATPHQGLGFASDGWRAAVIEDASGDPAGWEIRLVAPNCAPAGLVVGAALDVADGKVLALAIREPGDHAGFLVRWKLDELLPSSNERLDASALASALEHCEWWAGERGWLAPDALAGAPAPVLRDAGPESSLHFDPALSRWIHVKSLGFGATTIAVSMAERIEGPWSDPVTVFEPQESEREHAFVYAAKAHPELTGARLAVTYASNTLGDFAALVRDGSLYYPRFVRLSFDEH